MPPRPSCRVAPGAPCRPGHRPRRLVPRAAAGQRAVALASDGDLTAVVDSLLAEFEAGTPVWLPAREPAAALGEPGAAGATAGGGGT